MNKSQSFSIRASVIHTCNMNCVYCPKDTGMENYCPEKYKKNHLNTDDYISTLNKLISATGTSIVSITGGEPFLNKDLSKIIEGIRANSGRIELNTNGSLISEYSWKSVVSNIDEVKVSLDTLSEEHFMQITKLRIGDIKKVIKFIEMSNNSNVPLRLNCVLMKQNRDAIMDLIRFAKKRKIRLNLLDFYWTEEKSSTWKTQFIPVEELYDDLKNEFGEPEIFERFGCTFILFKDNDIAIVRTKSSFSGTMRSSKCNNCSEYCQEGIYCLRFSTQGWVTTCPSNSEEKGVLIKPEYSLEQVKEKINHLINDLQSAKYQSNTFDELIQKRKLNFTRSTQ